MIAPHDSQVVTRSTGRHHVSQLLDKTSFGFWAYLMTDLILFAALFATYAVLKDSTAGGPTGRELFNLPLVLVETIALLTSSLTIGLALLAARRGDRRRAAVWLVATFLLGASFLGIEIHEFQTLLADGQSWRNSAFLSAFFTLVGTHGAHITVGLIWIAVSVIRLCTQPVSDHTIRRLTLLSLFWHFLDIVWIFIFSFVYLLGVAA